MKEITIAVILISIYAWGFILFIGNDMCNWEIQRHELWALGYDDQYQTWEHAVKIGFGDILDLPVGFIRFLQRYPSYSIRMLFGSWICGHDIYTVENKGYTLRPL